MMIEQNFPPCCPSVHLSPVSCPLSEAPHGRLVEMQGFMESYHVWKGEITPPREAAPLLMGRGAVVTGGFYPGTVLSALISAIDEQRPCWGGLSGELASAQGRNWSYFALCKEGSLWVSQPAGLPYSKARAPAPAGTKTISALLGGQVGHFEAHLCIVLIYRFFLSSVFLKSRQDILMNWK